MLNAVVLLVWQSVSPSVEFAEGQFIVSGSGGRSVVELALESGPLVVNREKSALSLRIGTTSLKFDKSGFTLARSGVEKRTTLADVPVSGRIATKASNADLVSKLNSGERSLDVSAVSGYAVVDGRLYIVARWADKGGATWLEAALRLDPGEASPKLTLMAKLGGTSTARGLIDDVVGAAGADLIVPTVKSGQVGCWRMNPRAQASWTRCGAVASRAVPSESGQYIYTLSQTQHKTFLVGYALSDLPDSHRIAAEIRGAVIGFHNPHFLAYRMDDQVRLFNLITGGETAITVDSGVRYTPNGILVWHPQKLPKQATLYDGSFRELAVWSRPKGSL